MKSFIDRIETWQESASPSDTQDFCDLLCRTYENASPDLRSAIRKAVAANEKVRHSLLCNSVNADGGGGYLAETAKRAKHSGDFAVYLRSALLAISLTDGFEDSRDTLMWLAELWQDAEEHGANPSSHYEEIGRISSRTAVHAIGGPTAAMILQMLDERRRQEFT